MTTSPPSQGVEQYQRAVRAWQIREVFAPIAKAIRYSVTYTLVNMHRHPATPSSRPALIEASYLPVQDGLGRARMARWRGYFQRCGVEYPLPCPMHDDVDCVTCGGTNQIHAGSRYEMLALSLIADSLYRMWWGDLPKGNR